MSYTCDQCGADVQPKNKGVLTEVKGWAAPRDSGGVHHLIQRVATGRYVHKACLEPDMGEQPKLFE